jgi:nitric oxide dioxygenase
MIVISQASRPYIAASVPVLREHGLAITSVFYQRLFAENPGLKNLFNMGNQAQGVQQQSLAAAVFAYAANIDKPEVLKPVINRIVHKHASLGIKTEHYPIVGRHLLSAIKEVLGEAATEPLLNAWSEAYSMLADLLISEERKLYSNHSMRPGELIEVRVSRISQESVLIKAFELAAVDGKPLPAFNPGQYISVAVDFPDGSRQLRQYSLSDTPVKPHYRISVKREVEQADRPSGQVSNWLHENINVNDRIWVSPPYGDFVPGIDGDDPIILISAGVGITPMISTLNHLSHTQPKRPVIFAHAARDRSHHSHKDDIEAALGNMPFLRVATFYESIHESDDLNEDVFKGELQLSTIPGWDHESAEIYLCGPLGFMKKQWKELLGAGIAKQRIHREVFGPDLLDNLL